MYFLGDSGFGRAQRLYNKRRHLYNNLYNASWTLSNFAINKWTCKMWCHCLCSFTCVCFCFGKEKDSFFPETCSWCLKREASKLAGHFRRLVLSNFSSESCYGIRYLCSFTVLEHIPEAWYCMARKLLRKSLLTSSPPFEHSPLNCELVKIRKGILQNQQLITIHPLSVFICNRSVATFFKLYLIFQFVPTISLKSTPPRMFTKKTCLSIWISLLLFNSYKLFYWFSSRKYLLSLKPWATTFLQTILYSTNFLFEIQSLASSSCRQISPISMFTTCVINISQASQNSHFSEQLGHPTDIT